MDNEMRKMLWKAYPKFGIKDRTYLYAGPVGIVLLFVDWRIGLVMLLIGIPVLYVWKQRELQRVMLDEGMYWDEPRLGR